MKAPVLLKDAEGITIKNLKSKKIKFCTLVITPAIASYLLANMGKNRPIRRKTVKKYYDAMLEGRFMFADTIKIDEDGRLQDGQHRLIAIIQGGFTFVAPVVIGLKDYHFPLWDGGKGRTGADTVATTGFTNAAQMSTTIRMVHIYKTSGRFNDGTMLPNRLIYDLLGTPDSGGMGDALLDINSRIPHNIKEFVPPSVAAFCFYILDEKINDRDFIEPFFKSLYTGENLSKGSPILALRSMYMQRKILEKAKQVPLSNLWNAAVMFKAWNAYVLGNKVSRFTWDITKEFPIPRGMDGKK